MTKTRPGRAEAFSKNPASHAAMFAELTGAMISHHIQYSFGELAVLVGTPSVLIEGLEERSKDGTLVVDGAELEDLKTIMLRSNNDRDVFRHMLDSERNLAVTPVRATPRPQ